MGESASCPRQSSYPRSSCISVLKFSVSSLGINFLSPPFLSVTGTLTPAILLLLKCFRLRSRRNKVVWNVTKERGRTFLVKGT